MTTPAPFAATPARAHGFTATPAPPFAAPPPPAPPPPPREIPLHRTETMRLRASQTTASLSLAEGYIRGGPGAPSLAAVMLDVSGSLQQFSGAQAWDAFHRVLGKILDGLSAADDGARTRTAGLLKSLLASLPAARQDLLAALVEPLTLRLSVERTEAVTALLLELTEETVRFYVERNDLGPIARLLWEVPRPGEGTKLDKTGTGLRSLRGAEAVRRLAQSPLVELLVGRLVDPDPTQQNLARQSLLALGATTFPKLLAFVKSGADLAARRAAATVLRSANPQAESEVQKEISPFASKSDCVRLLEVYDLLSADPGGTILAALRHPEGEVRAGVVELLRRLERGAAVRVLLRALKDEDRAVLHTVIPWVGELRLAELSPTLVGLLKGAKDAEFQKTLCLTIGKLGDTSAVPALVEVMQRAPTLGFFGGLPEDVRSTAAWALGGIGGQDARDALYRAAGSDKSAAVRSSAKLALRE
ncbi:MAG: HEAT repeat domain-containing protein [Planctomycetes bacterium]|nr:HEAT repeat domain-containing protein [Planctomycetota bacterium]